MSELTDKKTDQQEIFEEIISLLHALFDANGLGVSEEDKRKMADEPGIKEKGGEQGGEETEVKQETQRKLR